MIAWDGYKSVTPLLLQRSKGFSRIPKLTFKGHRRHIPGKEHQVRILGGNLHHRLASKLRRKVVPAAHGKIYNTKKPFGIIKIPGKLQAPEMDIAKVKNSHK